MPKFKLGFVKKLSLVIFSSLLLFNSVMIQPLLALAQEEPEPPASSSTSSWYNSGIVDWYTKAFDTKNPSEIFGERYTAAQVQWILYSLFVFPLNKIFEGHIDGVICLLELGANTTFDLSACAQGFIDFISATLDRLIPHWQVQIPEKGFIATVFDTSNRSFSGINYTKERLAKFNIIPEAAAQGYGYNNFGIIRDSYWKAARDASYFLAVLAIIIFSFMIMFRVKISPQLVISVQSALPKVIGALILVTFSYAIAGFVVDFMYVVSGFLASILAQVKIASSFSRAYNVIAGNPLGFSTTYLGGPLTILVYMLLYLVLFVVSVIWNFLGAFLFSLSIVTGGGLTIVALGVAVVIIGLCVWYTIKIPWVLIKAVIAIYLSIIVGPLQIIFGVFAPNAGFGAWVKNLIANVMVFPLTGLLMYLAYDFLMYSYTIGSIVGALTNSAKPVCQMFGLLCSDSKINIWSPPLLGQDITGFVMLFISFGVIIAIPKATEIVKMLIMGEKFSFGTAIGEAVAPVSMYGSYAASRMNKNVNELPWPFNNSKTLNDWWNKKTNRPRDVVRSVADYVARAK